MDEYLDKKNRIENPNPTSQGFFIKFVQNNLDKFIILLISNVIAGIIGFFSAVIATKSQIYDLKSSHVERIQSLETYIDDVVKPNITKIDLITSQHNEFKHSEDNLNEDLMILKSAIYKYYMIEKQTQSNNK